MKVTASTLLAVVAFATSQAAAVPSAEADARRIRVGFCGAPGSACLVGRDNKDPQGDEVGYCSTPGSACHTVKRAAHAISEALAEARASATSTWCAAPGAPCDKAASAIDEIADKTQQVYERVYEREAEAEAVADPNAEARRRIRPGFCGAPGSACLVGRDAEPEAEAEARRIHSGFCGAPGSPCLNGRDAEAEPEAEARRRRHRIRPGFCGAPGSPCLSGRDAEPNARRIRPGFCGAPGSACLLGRDAIAEAEARRIRPGFCGAPGSPCLVGRDAEPEAEADAEARRIRPGFCGAPGSPCLSGRDAEAEAEARRYHRIRPGFCGAPGSPCLVGRDAEAIGKIFEANHPGFLRHECYKEGNECNTILKLKQVFQRVKYESDEANALNDVDQQLQHCNKPGSKCGVLTEAHAYAKKNNKAAAKRAEENCKKGICQITERDLAAIEETINEAVASLDAEE
ncbi:hypothetical protein LTR37_004820 [Vermiconidia calcicola]|uniref:Uncharacterized protein n=1 Tax=Vermiconidia calcicola TaxID=1690605 RepID=A0ACC3NL89_9PEZI|nr:hypothetical protein LTR37_004820 [Vermiconidia calcicola]